MSILFKVLVVFSLWPSPAPFLRSFSGNNLFLLSLYCSFSVMRTLRASCQYSLIPWLQIMSSMGSYLSKNQNLKLSRWKWEVLASSAFSSRIKENSGIVECVWYVAEKVVSEKNEIGTQEGMELKVVVLSMRLPVRLVDLKTGGGTARNL